ncbi:BON domain-containing protein [Marilutibacter maris]|uniref:BON domain-containing protein n=1 Tax=Marilutibacter maris TaxID=1605891 RepID=A0A2U9T5Q6_9GAMM|nr:BON domain-containing protein [Lysobacter maris]AWV08096.1 hypothetical protein C9I47_2418 [Lysobacter maris]
MTHNHTHIDTDTPNLVSVRDQTRFGRLSQLGARAALAALLMTGTAYAVASAPMQAGARGETVNEAESTQPVGDSWITTKVKAQLLADDDVEGSEIDVDTLEGVVHLSGALASQAEIDEAVSIARNTEGVVDVDASGLSVSSAGNR